MPPELWAVIFAIGNIWGIWFSIPATVIDPYHTYIQRAFGSLQLTSTFYAIDQAFCGPREDRALLLAELDAGVKRGMEQFVGSTKNPPFTNSTTAAVPDPPAFPSILEILKRDLSSIMHRNNGAITDVTWPAIVCFGIGVLLTIGMLSVCLLIWKLVSTGNQLTKTRNQTITAQLEGLFKDLVRELRECIANSQKTFQEFLGSDEIAHVKLPSSITLTSMEERFDRMQKDIQHIASRRDSKDHIQLMINGSPPQMEKMESHAPEDTDCITQEELTSTMDQKCTAMQSRLRSELSDFKTDIIQRINAIETARETSSREVKDIIQRLSQRIPTNIVDGDTFKSEITTLSRDVQNLRDKFQSASVESVSQGYIDQQLNILSDRVRSIECKLPMSSLDERKINKEMMDFMQEITEAFESRLNSAVEAMDRRVQSMEHGRAQGGPSPHSQEADGIRTQLLSLTNNVESAKAGQTGLEERLRSAKEECASQGSRLERTENSLNDSLNKLIRTIRNTAKKSEQAASSRDLEKLKQSHEDLRNCFEIRSNACQNHTIDLMGAKQSIDNHDSKLKSLQALEKKYDSLESRFKEYSEHSGVDAMRLATAKRLINTHTRSLSDLGTKVGALEQLFKAQQGLHLAMETSVTNNQPTTTATATENTPEPSAIQSQSADGSSTIQNDSKPPRLNSRSPSVEKGTAGWQEFARIESSPHEKKAQSETSSENLNLPGLAASIHADPSRASQGSKKNPTSDLLKSNWNQTGKTRQHR